MREIEASSMIFWKSQALNDGCNLICQMSSGVPQLSSKPQLRSQLEMLNGMLSEKLSRLARL